MISICRKIRKNNRNEQHFPHKNIEKYESRVGKCQKKVPKFNTSEPPLPAAETSFLGHWLRLQGLLPVVIDPLTGSNPPF